MASRLEELLNRGKNIENGSTVSNVLKNSGNMIKMEYENNTYQIAIRDKVLVFTDDMNLLYTIDMLELATTDNEFLKEVNKLVVDNTNQRVRLYINRANGVEHLTFSSIFDATYIFRKLVRLTSRKSEGIESIVIEHNAKVVRQYVNDNNKFVLGESAEKSVAVEDRNGRNPDKTEFIATLARVEDLVDEMIGSNVRNEGIISNNEKIDKCIELLEGLKDM